MKSASIDIKAKIKKANVGIEVGGGYKSELKESRHNTFDFEVEFGQLVESNGTIIPTGNLPSRLGGSTCPKPQKKKNWLVFILATIIVILVVILAMVLL